MTGAIFEGDDNVGSSHDADVDAAYDDDQPAADNAAGSDDLETTGGLDDQPAAGGESHAADIDAGFDDK